MTVLQTPQFSASKALALYRAVIHLGGTRREARDVTAAYFTGLMNQDSDKGGAS